MSLAHTVMTLMLTVIEYTQWHGRSTFIHTHAHTYIAKSYKTNTSSQPHMRTQSEPHDTHPITTLELPPQHTSITWPQIISVSTKMAYLTFFLLPDSTNLMSISQSLSMANLKWSEDKLWNLLVIVGIKNHPPQSKLADSINEIIEQFRLPFFPLCCCFEFLVTPTMASLPLLLLCYCYCPPSFPPNRQHVGRQPPPLPLLLLSPSLLGSQV